MSSERAGFSSDKNTRIDEFRQAIQTNRVAFPLPVPVFAYQHNHEVQWRVAELYLVHGWPPNQLASRYHITPNRVRQMVRGWISRARAMGYLQQIPGPGSNGFREPD